MMTNETNLLSKVLLKCSGSRKWSKEIVNRWIEQDDAASRIRETVNCHRFGHYNDLTRGITKIEEMSIYFE